MADDICTTEAQMKMADGMHEGHGPGMSESVTAILVPFTDYPVNDAVEGQAGRCGSEVPR